jgi:DNA excision repair protein ERCC-2
VSSKTIVSLSVGELVNQTARGGDIHFRFSGRSNAVDGIKGHQQVQKSRPADYLAEYKVVQNYETEICTLKLSGRADGIQLVESGLLVEEIKTTRAEIVRIPAQVQSMHFAQARIYAAMLLQTQAQSGLDDKLREKLQQSLAADDPIIVRLCYLDLADKQQHLIDESWTCQDLQSYLDGLINQYMTFYALSVDWAQQRNQSIVEASFPYQSFRPGQRDMAVSVYKTLRKESQLVMQAPTGIGKTIASLFPAIKSMPELGYEKIFFLSAKTSGQSMARDAITDLKEVGIHLRDVTITAKDKTCFNPGSPCDPEYCEFARGYYDKLPDVLADSVTQDMTLDRSAVELLAREHQMCPFELALDLSLIADVVICDYNYVFDPAVYLRRYFEDVSRSKYLLLMDESHNLVERGRDMFSAEINKETVLALKKELKDEAPLVAKKLTSINTQFLTLIKPAKPLLEKDGGVLLEDLADTFTRALRGFCDAAETWLQANQSGATHAQFLNLYFDVLRFLRTAEDAGESHRYLLLRGAKGVYLKLFCLNPGPGLQDGFSRVHSSVCFSATLSPQPYFETLMGIHLDADWYEIPTPFPAQNLGVFVTSYIPTTYRRREDSIYDLVDSLAEIVRAKKGNYIAFFPSHAYLRTALEKFTERYPGMNTLQQSSIMNDEERLDFLNQFDDVDTEKLGFAVMGGVFGEGVDLKGSKLIGAIIVGVGLPQLSLERDLIRDYFDERVDSSEYGRTDGFDYAYQYPGMNRVLQTAGRVIRSETDLGIVCLIDHRFNESRYRQLFPVSWQPQVMRNKNELAQSVKQFWSNIDADVSIKNDINIHSSSERDSELN